MLPLDQNTVVTNLSIKLGKKEINCEIKEKVAGNETYLDWQSQQNLAALTTLKEDDDRMVEILVGTV